jgi:hypothetical protein
VVASNRRSGPDARFHPCGLKRRAEGDLCAILERKARHPGHRHIAGNSKEPLGASLTGCPRERELRYVFCRGCCLPEVSHLEGGHWRGNTAVVRHRDRASHQELVLSGGLPTITVGSGTRVVPGSAALRAWLMTPTMRPLK